ncbi:MAG: hypothetical protein RIC19_16655 [Phaeodactylibacter sp.]|uniref:carboxypeptidase regulatory-like domain-containing protein n=1 Tax=Phaeodactylibacter sp. TaxID=1940289 RepID=UPI0032EC120A
MKRLPVYFAALALILSGCTTTDSITQATPTPMDTVSRTAPDSILTLQGTTQDPSGAPLLFCTIAAYQDNTLIKGTEADFNGYYTITLPAHTELTLKALYVGHETATYQLQPLPPGSYLLNAYLTPKKQFTEGLYCPSYRIPLIDRDNTSSGATYHSSDLKHSPLFPGGL